MDQAEEEKWKKWDKFMREQYPPGTRIKLGKMVCPYADVPPGTEGTVERAASALAIPMKWDNGSEHELIPGTDHFSVIGLKPSQFKLYMPICALFLERDGQGEYADDFTDLDGRGLVPYKEEILSMIKRQELPLMADRGLMGGYLEPDTLNAKVISARPTVPSPRPHTCGRY